MKINLTGIVSCILLLMCVDLFTGCKKDSSAEEQNMQEQTNALPAETGTKVNAWLEKQKAKASLAGITRINALKSNLDFSSGMTKDLMRSDSIIIIPLKGGYETKINAEKSPVNMLVIFLDDRKEVSKGYIVQYISSRKFIVKKDLLNFMFDYYDFRINHFTGSLAYLTVADEFSYELSYVDDVNQYYKTVGQKKADGITETCYEVGFYYYWSDGSVTWEPIGGYCDGCEPAKTINGKTYRTGCGGGGGGETPEVPTETTEVWWEVYREFASGPDPYIMAAVQLWGKKVAGEPQGGHFIQSNDHGIRAFNFDMYGMGFSGSFSQSWHSPQRAYQAVQGTVTYSVPGALNKYISPTKTFQFLDVF